MTLDELNRMDAQSAADLLQSCCGSRRWAQAVSARRPFSNIVDLHQAFDLVSTALGPEDWLDAFASHPRIGETKDVSRWSEKEQEGMTTAADDVRSRLARLNQEYDERFGFIFIICATGKPADEMLAQLEKRISNRLEDEICIASEEQKKIVHLRLNKLVDR